LSCDDLTAACTACKGTNRNNDFPNCTCATGFFDDGSNSDCLQCSYPCFKCYGTASACTECVSGTNRDSIPNCSCNDGYYDDGTIC